MFHMLIILVDVRYSTRFEVLTKKERRATLELLKNQFMQSTH